MVLTSCLPALGMSQRFLDITIPAKRQDQEIERQWQKNIASARNNLLERVGYLKRDFESLLYSIGKRAKELQSSLENSSLTSMPLTNALCGRLVSMQNDAQTFSMKEKYTTDELNRVEVRFATRIGGICDTCNQIIEEMQLDANDVNHLVVACRNVCAFLKREMEYMNVRLSAEALLHDITQEMRKRKPRFEMSEFANVLYKLSPSDERSWLQKYSCSQEMINEMQNGRLERTRAFLRSGNYEDCFLIQALAQHLCCPCISINVCSFLYTYEDADLLADILKRLNNCNFRCIIFFNNVDSEDKYASNAWVHESLKDKVNSFIANNQNNNISFVQRAHRAESCAANSTKYKFYKPSRMSLLMAAIKQKCKNMVPQSAFFAFIRSVSGLLLTAKSSVNMRTQFMHSWPSALKTAYRKSNSVIRNEIIGRSYRFVRSSAGMIATKTCNFRNYMRNRSVC